MSGLAGRLRQRVTILRQATTRDAIGAAAGDWQAIGETWGAIAPAGTGPAVAAGARAAPALWRITLRDRDLRIGDRIRWAGGTMMVTGVTRDPALPDRLGATGEEIL